MFSKSLILTLAMLFSSVGFAEGDSDKTEVWYMHNHLSAIYIYGEAAKKVYDRLQVQKIVDLDPDHNKTGSFTKVSTDKRLKCQENKGAHKCEIFFDSATGEVAPN